MIALVVLGSCLVVGCGKKEQEEPKPAAAAVVAADPNSVGVAECDDYFKKIDQCVVANPAQKAAMEQTKTQMIAMFKSMATAPGGKEKLKADCLDHLQRLPPNCSK